jgi:membrane associated rhomboid family serine protease
MFLHGGFFHLAFNMCFLWAFGRNVEGSMNPAGFLVFYLVAGMASGLAQSLAAASATVPTIGASGAIAAVVAGYLVLYPRARVLTWVLFPLPIFLWLYAWLVAGGWGILQVAATWLSLFAPTTLDGGVATIAHLAGFAFGLLLISVFADRPHPEYAMIIAAEQADRE